MNARVYAFNVKEILQQALTGDLRGLPLSAQAKLFQEFNLLLDNKVILSLKYVFDAAIEQQGATSFRCEYGSARWTLQHSQSSFLQADSYRVFCDDKTAATFVGRWAFLSAKLTLADGASFTCVRGFYQTIVRGLDGKKIATAKVNWTGSILGGSSIIHVEQSADPGWVIPLLLILIHLTTQRRD